MSDKRITPAEVLAAYRATGLRPIQCAWRNSGGTCGCPVQAMWMAAGSPDLARTDNHREFAPAPERWLYDNYGAIYGGAFLCGVDGDRIGSPVDREAEGIADGKSAWKAVVAAGLTKATK